MHGLRLPHVRPIRKQDFGGEGPVSHALIAGVGNVLLGDDGFGPYVVQLLDSLYRFAETVEIADLGTPALDLTHRIVGLDLLILIDSIAATDMAGTVHLY